MLPTFCVTVSQNFSQIDISVIEINSVLGIGVSLSIYILYTYTPMSKLYTILLSSDLKTKKSAINTHINTNIHIHIQIKKSLRTQDSDPNKI